MNVSTNCSPERRATATNTHTRNTISINARDLDIGSIATPRCSSHDTMATMECKADSPCDHATGSISQITAKTADRRKSLLERQRKRYANRHISQGDTDDEDEEISNKKDGRPKARLIDYRRKWIKNIIAGVILAAIAMTPGLICHYSNTKCSPILGQPLFSYSQFVAISIGIYIGARILTVILFSVLRRVKITSSRISYYANHLISPLHLLLWTIFVYITWVFYFSRRLEGLAGQIRGYEGPFFTSLFIFGIGYLVNVILVRYMSIRFFKAAYSKQIFNAMFVEYVLSAILHREKMSSSTKANSKKNLVSAAIYQINLFGSDDSFHVKIGSLRINEKAIQNHDLNNLDFSTMVQNFRDNPFIQCIHQEISNLSKLSGKREALKVYARNLFEMAKENNGEIEELSELHFSNLFKNPRLAKKAFLEFDVNRDGELTLEEFHAAFVTLYKQRKTLAKTLVEGEGAVKKLSAIITVLALMVYIILALAVFNVDVTGLLVTISSIALAMSFAFASLLKNMVNSIIFIFFSHPFDVGDRVTVEGVTYTVGKMNILSTELIRFDNTWIFYPNAKLFQLDIINHNRSPDQVDIVVIEVNYATTMEKITVLESRLNQFVSEYSNHYYNKIELEIRDVDCLNKLTLRVWIRHRSNFHNMKRYRSRRSFAMLNVKHILEDLQINYQIPTQRIELSKLSEVL